MGFDMDTETLTLTGPGRREALLARLAAGHKVYPASSTYGAMRLAILRAAELWPASPTIIAAQVLRMSIDGRRSFLDAGANLEPIIASAEEASTMIARSADHGSTNDRAALFN